jgi:tRNA-dihydrouridine synthase
VIGNGDVITAADARLMLERTGCAAVMIGRSALGNPWIFSELTTGQQAPRNKWPVIEQHFKEHVAFVDDALMAVRRFRPHFAWYARGLQHAQHFCERINRADDLERVAALAEDFFSSAQAAEINSSFADFDTKMALG